MTQGQKDSISQRTVLLATDHSQSIIGEIVDGKANAIAYSAYGHQSAQQDVTTRLGFNGQLREMQTSWYLLGNGYRAHNPRLMRFHSPDSWSPFNGGGLNAYMYCVGDPVNRSDPTGHFSLTNFIFGTMRFFSGDPGYHASGGGRGLLEIGAAIGSRAPNPGGISSTPIGNSPAIHALGSGPTSNFRPSPPALTGPGATIAAVTSVLGSSGAKAGAGSQARPPIGGLSSQGSGGMADGSGGGWAKGGGKRGSVGSFNGPPPSYDEAMKMPLYDANTIAATGGNPTYAVYSMSFGIWNTASPIIGPIRGPTPIPPTNQAAAVIREAPAQASSLAAPGPAPGSREAHFTALEERWRRQRTPSVDSD